MNQPRYELIKSSDRLTYLFISKGYKGDIVKVVSYSYLSDIQVWNLGFGDYNTATGEIDDTVVTNNGDGRKVLATVASTLTDFFNLYPDAIVYFVGSTGRRTQIYGWAISNYWDTLSARYEVEGLNKDGSDEPFQIGKTYSGYRFKLNQTGTNDGDRN